MFLFITYCLLGLIIGFLSGLLGIGGGLVAVPALSWILQHQGIDPELIMHMATGTSLATVIFTSLASIRAFNKQGEIVWRTVKKLIPGIVIGAFSGGMIAHRLSSHDLRILFGLFMLIIAFQLLFEKKRTIASPTTPPPPSNKKHWNHHAIALSIGLSAGILGVSGSIIVIPYLLYKGFTIRQASGTSITCALPVAIIATISILFSSWNTPNLPPYSFGYINWLAAIGISIPSIFSVTLGASLGKRLPQTTLRKLFAIFLIFVSFNMLF